MALSLIAVILGIFYTIRKLDARSRSATEFPWVAPDRFHAWQEQEVRVYGRGALACVAKLVLGIIAEYWLAPNWPSSGARFVGFAIDFSWFVAVIITFVLGARLGRKRRELGIVLDALRAPPERDEEHDSPRSSSDSSKPAP